MPTKKEEEDDPSPVRSAQASSTQIADVLQKHDAQLRQRITSEQAQGAAEAIQKAENSTKTDLPPPPAQPAQPARAETRRSFLRKYASTIAPVLLTVFVAYILPKVSQPVYPSRYAVCSYQGDSRVRLSADKTADCVLVNKDIVEWTGSYEDIQAEFGNLDRLGSVSTMGIKDVLNPYSPKRTTNRAGLKIFMLKRGQHVLPGLTDAHGHILEYGHSLGQIDLQGARSVPEVIQRIVNFISQMPPGSESDYTKIFEGRGFDQTNFPGGQFPTARDLEVGALRGRKIFLERVDLHACWISLALLDSLDVPESIPGGVILRDEQGKPTGVFLDTAYTWVMAQLPKQTEQKRIQYMREASRALLSKGIVGVHDAASSLEAIDFYKRLDIQQRLPLRVYSMVACPEVDSYCGDQVEPYSGGRLSIRSVKLFLDGALGSWGAAMLEPYSDNPAEKGIVRLSAEKLDELVEKWAQKGFQVNSHGIGDRANRMIVDAYEKYLVKSGKRNAELRLRMEHAQIMSQEDIERAGRLGLVASVQPTHCTSDMHYAESRLGSERVKGAYAWQSLVKAGAPIALGSDFPVESINPFEGIFAAVTRLNSTSSSPHGPGGWYPSERLSREQALRGFTEDAAWASFQEHKLGRLEVRMKADLIVVDRDIMTVEAAKIRETLVSATVLDGRVVFGKLY